MIDVRLRGFGMVMSGLRMMGVRQVSVVTGFLVIAVFMVFGGFVMMFRRLLVMLRCVRVVLGRLFCVFHVIFPACHRATSRCASGMV